MDDDVKLVTLIRTDDEISGSIVVAALENAGIKATMTGGFTAGFRAEAPGYVNIVIRQRDLERAREVLKSTELPSEVNWDEVDTGTPDETEPPPPA